MKELKQDSVGWVGNYQPLFEEGPATQIMAHCRWAPGWIWHEVMENEESAYQIIKILQFGNILILSGDLNLAYSWIRNEQ